MVAKKMGPSQAPICEAFIMTGETILKTYTNKSETGGSLRAASNQNHNKTAPLPDSTTPSLKATLSAVPQQTNLDTLTTSKSECTSSGQLNHNNNIICSNNNNNNSAQDYIKHAQYRVAAALEQRRKSLSMSKLNELGQTNGPANTADGSFLIGLNRTSGVAGDTNRWRESIREEASVTASPRTLLQQQRLHEQQQQQPSTPPTPATRQFQEQKAQEQLQRAQELEKLQHQQQQKHLHEHVGGRQNSEQHSMGPLESRVDSPSNLETNSKPKDCETPIGKQMELVSKQHRPQERKRQLNQHQYQMDQHPTPVTRTATFIVTSRRDLSKLNGGQKFDENDFSIEFKTGHLNRKRTFEPKGKPTSKGQRGWRRVYIILRDLRFIVRHAGQNEHPELDAGDKDKDKEASTTTDPAVHKMEEQSAKARKQLAAKDLKNTIRLHHAFAKRSTTYTKREYVFHLYLADQSELLLQASSESEMNSWIDTINFASACLSSPPLPSAVSSSNKRYHQSPRSRPILPTSYTKLSYWEQLTDHEERLERLKAELEEHLNEAPVKRHASKRSKSDFIDKIAYLRQTIEHYTVYLDLMQKKSNSPEAIVLSKHPQIASLTPSKEMVRSLPLNAKTHEDEDKKAT